MLTGCLWKAAEFGSKADSYFFLYCMTWGWGTPFRPFLLVLNYLLSSYWIGNSLNLWVLVWTDRSLGCSLVKLLSDSLEFTDTLCVLRLDMVSSHSITLKAKRSLVLRCFYVSSSPNYRYSSSDRASGCLKTIPKYLVSPSTFSTLVLRANLIELVSLVISIVLPILSLHSVTI